MTLAFKVRDANDAAHDRARPNARLAIIALSLCTLMPSLGTSIANVALPTFTQAFGASFSEVQWVVLAYLLAITTAAVGVGRLGDLVGRRRLLLAGIALFTGASLACGGANTFWVLVAARSAQGLGAAVMMALTVAMVRDAVPEAKTGTAMGLLGSMSAVGTMLGPSAGGLLVAGFGWRSIFFVNLPLGAAGLFLAWRYLPSERGDRHGHGETFDYVGMVLMGLTLTAYALAMTVGRGGGATGPLNAALLAVAAAGVVAFILVERRTRSPFIQLTMFRDSSLSASLVMSMLVSVVAMTTLVVGPFYLSQSLHLATVHVGIVMSAGPIAAALAGTPAGRLTDRLGTSRTAAGGLLAMVGGCLALAAVPGRLGVVVGYVVPVVIVTTGYALFQAANNTAVITGAASNRRGLVSGMLNLSRYLGLVTGAAAMGNVFRLASGAGDVSKAAPERVEMAMHITFAVATAIVLVAMALSRRDTRAVVRRTMRGSDV